MLWRKRVTALASEFPDIELSHMYVDNAAMQLVRNPKQVCFSSFPLSLDLIHCTLAKHKKDVLILISFIAAV
jgi:hypothetical protein